LHNAFVHMPSRCKGNVYSPALMTTWLNLLFTSNCPILITHFQLLRNNLQSISPVNHFI
jgi:hypothetical protein